MLSKKEEVELGKFLSFVLRHKPEAIGIELDKNGWVSIENLIAKSATQKTFTIDDLLQVVANNSKKRYAISDDGKSIRASQGHSVEVDLGLSFVEPPEYLYHGTATKYLDSIGKTGLQSQSRHDVHLSKDYATAKQVGERHGEVVVLKIKSQEMFKNGFGFQCSQNNVWLTKEVPLEYIDFNYKHQLKM